MGMFDYVRCEMPLPDPEVQGAVFQTKDTPSQFLDSYVIRADGRLFQEHPELEEVPPEERDPDTDLPILRRVGDPVSVEWTGELRFYTLHPDTTNGRWYEYIARIWKGEVKEIERTPRHWKREDADDADD